MSDSIDILKERVGILKNKVRDIKIELLQPAENNLREAEQKLAEAMCFCKVGDRIKEKGSIIEFIVGDIIPSTIYGFILRVHKIKKNGEPYLYPNNIYNYSRDWSGWEITKKTIDN